MGGYGAGGYGYRRPFFSGMMGGLLGAGLLGMMLGGGFFGFHGGFGFLGLAAAAGAAVLGGAVGAAQLCRRTGDGRIGGYARGMMPQQGVGGGYGGGGGGAPTSTLSLTQADYKQFSQLLAGIQAAWSASDLNGLSALATPEMVSYFAEQLAELQSRGLRNRTSDVRLLHGDLSEAWAEGNREYATVSLRYAMFDVTTNASGQVVDGSATEHVTVTEFWTFLRATGGHWLLSAIQQARVGSKARALSL
ncbi:MAG: TIM44-like domain-containing protein [Rhodospirillales bacterium]